MRKKIESSKVVEQKGRSLVELLGVLVVAGVLSVAGLYVFDYAMEKWREGETVNRFSKVVAGARSSSILEGVNEGYKTKYLIDGDWHKSYAEIEGEEYFHRQTVNIEKVISNVGDDLVANGNGGYLLAPQKGPFNRFNVSNMELPESYEPKEVEIWVEARTPSAFTVHATNLTLNTCKKIVQSNLGHNWGFEAAYDEFTGGDATTYRSGVPFDNWYTGPQLYDDSVAEELCKTVVESKDEKELVLWFGGVECLVGDECSRPEDPCLDGRPVCTDDSACAGDEGEVCFNGCCVVNQEETSILPKETTSYNEGSPYCAREKWTEKTCTELVNGSKVTYTCVNHSECMEYKNTDAMIMRDPTSDKRRALEIPMVGELEGKYPYCSLVINDKCALVSYCDVEPTAVEGLLQKCEACTQYDVLKKTCLGSTLISHAEAFDLNGTKVLYHYSIFSKNDPNDSPIGSTDPKEPVEPTEECVDPSDCSDGYEMGPNGKCCPTSQTWFDCEENCSYVNACGVRRPIATICCPGEWSGPNMSCGDIGHSSGCFGAGAINTGNGLECCSQVCYDSLSQTEGKYCCETQADGSKGESCCEFMGGTWEYIPGRKKYGKCVFPVTTVPETTMPETTALETTMPETTTPIVSDTTIPETTTPIVSDTTTPETTIPETTIPETTNPLLNHQCYQYCVDKRSR